MRLSLDVVRSLRKQPTPRSPRVVKERNRNEGGVDLEVGRSGGKEAAVVVMSVGKSNARKIEAPSPLEQSWVCYSVGSPQIVNSWNGSKLKLIRYSAISSRPYKASEEFRILCHVATSIDQTAIALVI